jgi:hypothetical protein
MTLLENQRRAAPMSNEDLDINLELILEAMPDLHDDGKKYSLTKHDVELFASMIKLAARSQRCSLGITPEQADDVVTMIRERKRILALVGTLFIGVLAYIGQKLIDALAPEFWYNLTHWK